MDHSEFMSTSGAPKLSRECVSEGCSELVRQSSTFPVELPFRLYALGRCAVVPLTVQDMPGFSLGQKIEGKCGMRASMTAELVFDGVEVGHGNILHATCQPPLDCTRT